MITDASELDLPFSQACERTKAPILEVLKDRLQSGDTVLEIGSGTGQHAEYFAEHLPKVHWQTADQQYNVLSLTERVNRAGLPNLLLPFRLDVNDTAWLTHVKPKVCLYDAVFTANTLHIMDTGTVENFFKGLALNTRSDAQLIIYGPIRDKGRFNSDSNAEFDQSLRSRGVGSAIRDKGWIEELAAGVGFSLTEDINMPANNQCLVFQASLAR
jgi:cyclopropane fatty-acyl-phospholipid synthase-like methyltransferase